MGFLPVPKRISKSIGALKITKVPKTLLAIWSTCQFLEKIPDAFPPPSFESIAIVACGRWMANGQSQESICDTVVAGKKSIRRPLLAKGTKATKMGLV